jgi:outer membrane protein TolC
MSLGEHLKHIETKLATGSATEYQVLSTKVKMSAVNSQKVDLEAALKYQQAYLNALLGLPENSKPVVSNDFSVDVPVVSKDSLVSYAFHNRNEILLNEMKASVAGLRYDLLKAMNRPIISFMATGGAKNGYVPDLNRIKPNYVFGVGVRIPLYDGSKTKYNLLQAQSSINALHYENESSRRVITSEIKEAEAYMDAAYEKISQFRLQLDQAMKAFSLAQVSFEAGTITNLDLLDANNAVSESRLMLMKATIDYTASVYRLKAAIGEKVY